MLVSMVIVLLNVYCLPHINFFSSTEHHEVATFIIGTQGTLCKAQQLGIHRGSSLVIGLESTSTPGHVPRLQISAWHVGMLNQY